MKRELIDWKTRAVRRKLALPGMAVSAQGREFKILLSNISYEGCHLMAEHDLSVGEVIQIDIPGMGRMQAQVRWSTTTAVFVSFWASPAPKIAAPGSVYSRLISAVAAL